MATHIINGDKAHVIYYQERDLLGWMPWVATWDGYDDDANDYETPSSDPVGEGDTELEALEDLLEKSCD